MNKSLPSVYQSFVAISRYARWLDESKRRELWPETALRYCKFFDDRTGGEFSSLFMDEIFPAISGLETMPSMRALMTAGEALARENLAGYNCAYLAINNKRKFAEAQYHDWLAKYPMPSIDWADLGAYEEDDNTTSAQTLACTGNVCEMVGVAPAKSV